MNPYQILNIGTEASPADIKKAYFKLVKQYTPEKDPEKFKAIRHAYDQLKSLSGRAQIDFDIIKEPAGDFLQPSAAEVNALSSLKIEVEDFIVIAEALYSDLPKTDFRDDYTHVI